MAWGQDILDFFWGDTGKQPSAKSVPIAKKAPPAKAAPKAVVAPKKSSKPKIQTQPTTVVTATRLPPEETKKHPLDLPIAGPDPVLELLGVSSPEAAAMDIDFPGFPTGIQVPQVQGEEVARPAQNVTDPIMSMFQSPQKEPIGEMLWKNLSERRTPAMEESSDILDELRLKLAEKEGQTPDPVLSGLMAAADIWTGSKHVPTLAKGEEERQKNLMEQQLDLAKLYGGLSKEQRELVADQFQNTLGSQKLEQQAIANQSKNYLLAKGLESKEAMAAAGLELKDAQVAEINALNKAVQEAKIGYDVWRTKIDAVLEKGKIKSQQDTKVYDTKVGATLQLALQKMRGDTQEKIASIRARAGKGKGGKKQLSEKTVKELSDMDSMLGQIEDAYDNFNRLLGNEDFTSRAGSILSSKTPLFTTNAKLFEQKRTAITKALASALESGRISNEDFGQYTAALPNVGDTPDQAREKLITLQRYLSNKKNTYIKNLEYGYDVPSTIRPGVVPKEPRKGEVRKKWKGKWYVLKPGVDPTIEANHRKPENWQVEK